MEFGETSEIEFAGTRYTSLPLSLKAVILILVALCIGLSVFFLFGFTVHGQPLIESTYYWLCLAIFYFGIFIVMPARKKDRVVPWYDYLLAFLAAGVFLYGAWRSWDISVSGWYNIPMGAIILVLTLEAARRGGGNIFLVAVLILASYPLYGDYMPGMFWGLSHDFGTLVRKLAFGEEALMGMMTNVMTRILIGFLVFAGFLLASGGGEFFLKIACALVGKYRGGPAKVAVLASGLFGSMSGSIVSNVVGTGCITIPTMKRMGYPAHYAGAVEAVASTGGAIMPPVMGAVVFIMCEFLGMEYRSVIVAAAPPAILYYFGLLMQVDAFAAKTGLKGLPEKEIPSFCQTLKEGWPFIAVIIFLVWGLVYMRWEWLAPWYASGLVFFFSFYRKKTWLTPRRIARTLATIGILVFKTSSLIIPISFIMAGLSISGVSLSFASGLVNLGLSDVFLVLLFGVIAIYIMGMAGLTIPAYVFLGVTMAPAVIKVANLNELAVHLFIIYYAVMAAFTPPVAAAAFVAAAIAGAPPMKTGLTAMRLGIVIYFVPWFFLFNPALIFQGSLLDFFYCFALSLAGIILIAWGCEGYVLKVGKINPWARPFLIISGLLIGFPEMNTTIIGAILVFMLMAVMGIRKKLKHHKE